MATVTFDGASRIYSKDAERPAVDRLNLDISDGEFWSSSGLLAAENPPAYECSLALSRQTEVPFGSAEKTSLESAHQIVT